jgi:hypothetical protein
MTRREHSWPTRDEYEAQQRSHAEHMIEHGVGYADEYSPTFTDAERAEIAALSPEIIKTVRRECGRIERPLRHQYPEVVWLLDPGTDRYLSGEYDAAVATLNPDQLAALDTLRELRDVRWVLRYGGFDFAYWDASPPPGFEPACPELDRLREIHERALARYHDRERQRGRQLLADIESGVEWQRQQEHMARIDEYFRNGPVVHHRRT